MSDKIPSILYNDIYSLIIPDVRVFLLEVLQRNTHNGFGYLHHVHSFNTVGQNGGESLPGAQTDSQNLPGFARVQKDRYMPGDALRRDLVGLLRACFSQYRLVRPY